MTPRRSSTEFERIWALADRAAELEGDRRLRFLNRVCEHSTERAEIELLLDGVAKLAANGHDEPSGEAPGMLVATDLDHIGPYRIHGVLGCGGQGVVYEAEQPEPRRRVALKVLNAARADQDHHARRFRREIRILAHLTHPSIATIFESGQTQEGHCFFTMERVDGEPLDAWVARRDLEREDVLRLFLQVCDAIQHAHERGVVHRDLKPTNILVDATGRAKVLDFGLASVADTELHAASLDTRTARLQGTLPYMSPEQVGARSDSVDARSDVYSLGVILYQMLTGKRPLPIERRSLLAAIRIVGERPPTPPRRLDRTLAGALETILLVTLEKDPELRYPSVAELAEDIRRHLRHEPVRARPPSLAYRARKLVRRNAVLTVAACLLVTVSGVFALVTSRQSADVADARQTADARARRVGAVEQFAKRLLASANPYVLGPRMEIDRMVDRAAGSLHELFRDDPIGEAEMRMAIAQAYRFLSRPREALVHVRRAIELRRTALGPETDTLEILDQLGTLCLETGKREEAERVFRRTLAMREALPQRGGALLSDNLIHLSQSMDVARGAERETLARRALAMREQRFEPPHPMLTTAQAHLARVLRSRGQLDAAEELCRAALAKCPQECDPFSTAYLLLALADVLWDKRCWCDSLEAGERAHEIYRRLLGDEHAQTRGALSRVTRVVNS